MSSLAGRAGDHTPIPGCFGTPEDWGLSRQKHAEMQAELEDHLDCLQADEGIPAAEMVREKLAKPAARRKLAGVHLADQVYATLNRLPTKQEWRELIFLLICFALIVLSDWLAVKVHDLLHGYYMADQSLPLKPDAWVAWLAAGGWLLQGCAKAAFFAGLACSLWRAWQLGAGVLLARILQFKLVLTVLVVASTLLSARAFNWVGHNAPVYEVAWPAWLNAPVLSIVVIALALVLLAFNYRRTWAWSLGLILAAVLLYPGGPAQGEMHSVATPILSEWVWQDDVCCEVASTDQAAIEERVARWHRNNPGLKVDVQANRVYGEAFCLKPVPGMHLMRSGCQPAGMRTRDGYNRITEYEPAGREIMTGPVVDAGSGIGWLSIPIPLFGLLGFAGLLLVMGRRGKAELLAYSSICILGLIATIKPFVYEIASAEIMELTVRGWYSTPLPGFISVLTQAEVETGWMIIVGGFVLSAGVPWLLTSLFLRPDRSAGAETDTFPARQS